MRRIGPTLHQIEEEADKNPAEKSEARGAPKKQGAHNYSFFKTRGTQLPTLLVPALFKESLYGLEHPVGLPNARTPVH